MLEAKYKFYLSFENSICEEYVTEKFFEIANRDIVPIVYGGADYKRIAPPHSFIDALEFTPEALAQYLTILDANDELYNEFFWWKSHYKVEAGLKQMARHGFCDLCKKLHQDQVPKCYPELETEWDPKNKCWEN
jgi:alpha-1,3-fucosyltransferase